MQKRRSRYSLAEEITPVHADFLVEPRGFEPLIAAVQAPTGAATSGVQRDFVLPEPGLLDSDTDRFRFR
jgi:hypothetical protein